MVRILSAAAAVAVVVGLLTIGASAQTIIQKQESGDEGYLRDNWFYGQRAYPYKTIPSGALLGARSRATAMRQVALSSFAAPYIALNWSALGPRPIPDGRPSKYNGAAPWSGRVTVIAHDPSNAAIAYLGSADGGVWKTVNSGANWTPVSDSLPTLAIGSIAVDPQNPSTIYVGTGEANVVADSYFGAGIFKSTNGGASWSKIGGSFDTCYVGALAVQPGSSSILFAGVRNTGRYSTSCTSGLYRSTDGGANWVRAAFLSGLSVNDIVSRPGTPTIWYAAVEGNGIWASYDDGLTWTPLRVPVPTADLGRAAVSVTPANPSRIYAAFGNSATGKALGVWTSLNDGSTWTQLMLNHDFCASSDDAPTGSCHYDLSLSAYPGNENYVYVGGVFLQRWDGSTWTTLGYDGTSAPGTIHVDFHSLSFDSQNRLWAGSDGGAYRKDGGSMFENLNQTLGISQFYPGISGSPSSLLLGGVQDNGSLQYRPFYGWYELELGDGGYTAYDGVHGYRFTTYVRATVIRDDVSGVNPICVFTADKDSPYNCQQHAIDALGVFDPSLFISPLVQSPWDPATLYLGTNQVWKTNTDGAFWFSISPHYPGYVSAIAQSDSNPNVVYAAWSQMQAYDNFAGSSFVAVTQYGGPPWSGTQALPWRFITDIAVKPSAPNVAWVTLSGYNTGHVYLTQNYGATWTNISGNLQNALPNAPVNAIAVDSRTSPSTLYVATDVGVFWSTDGGASWGNTSVGLPHSVVMDIMVVPSTNMLVAVTHGRGAFTAPIPRRPL